jgi:hypothetical protein
MSRDADRRSAPVRRSFSRYDSNETRTGARYRTKATLIGLLAPGLAGGSMISGGGSRPLGIALIGVSIALAVGLAIVMIRKAKQRARIEQSRLARRDQRP